MSKVNQALKDLREDAKHHLDSHIVYLNERLDIIEEKLKEGKKEHKVIKIIKNKQKIEQEYLAGTDIVIIGLTRKEYDLLKEALQ